MGFEMCWCATFHDADSLHRQKVARTRSSNLLPLGRTPPHLMKQDANATSPPTVTDRSCSSNCPSPCVSGCHSSQLCRYAAAPSYFIEIGRASCRERGEISV